MTNIVSATLTGIDQRPRFAVLRHSRHDAVADVVLFSAFEIVAGKRGLDW